MSGQVGERSGPLMRMEDGVVECEREVRPVPGLIGLHRVILVGRNQSVAPNDEAILNVLVVFQRAVCGACVLPKGGNVSVVEILVLEPLVVDVDGRVKSRRTQRCEAIGVERLAGVRWTHRWR